tara:strand:+ start:1162 stop:1521 length:360 start_codon:yes stop_codon:yes gene_type:complete
MSDAFYDSMAATAAKLITKFGAVGTLTRTTGGSVNPVTGAIIAGTTVTYSPNTIVQKYSDDIVNGTRILSSDRLIILDNTIEPLTTDVITIRGENWTVISIAESRPAGIPLVYFVQARR